LLKWCDWTESENVNFKKTFLQNMMFYVMMTT